MAEFNYEEELNQLRKEYSLAKAQAFRNAASREVVVISKELCANLLFNDMLHDSLEWYPTPHASKIAKQHYKFYTLSWSNYPKGFELSDFVNVIVLV